MSRINFDPTSATEQALKNISTAMGIKSFSNSSKAKLFADVLISEVHDLTTMHRTVLDSLYPETALLTDLDNIGRSFAVPRSRNDSLYINESHKVLQIAPADGAALFGMELPTDIILPRGTIFDIGGSASFTLSKAVTLSRGSVGAYLSGTLTPLGANSFKFSTDSIEKIGSLVVGRFDVSSIVSILVNRAINLDGVVEDDEQYRQRVIMKRDGVAKSEIEHVLNVMNSVRGLDDFAVFPMARGGATMDVGMVVSDLDKYSHLRFVVADRLAEALQIGVDVSIFFAEAFEMHVSYSIDGMDDIMKNNIFEALKMAHDLYYQYSDNIIDVVKYADYVRIKIQDDTFNITSYSIVDTAYDAIIYKGIQRFECPKKHNVVMTSSIMEEV